MAGPAVHARIAALPGEPSAKAQALLSDFAAELTRNGVKAAGVIQTRVSDAAGRRRIVLRDTAGAALFAISQDLGPGSAACNLDTRELARACAFVERAVASGAELVVISKFSKQEALRGGLCDAFRAAIAAKTPVVTAVSPHYLEEWRAFAGPLAEFLEPEREALLAWWERTRAGSS